jgi:hypothetical protein
VTLGLSVSVLRLGDCVCGREFEGVSGCDSVGDGNVRVSDALMESLNERLSDSEMVRVSLAVTSSVRVKEMLSV